MAQPGAPPAGPGRGPCSKKIQRRQIRLPASNTEIQTLPNTHRAYGVWKAFNARHGGRFIFHFTPLHASWVNQIELLFAIYTRRILRHASHRSTAHLRLRTQEFVAQRNRSPQPFKWTFAGFELQTGQPKRFHSDARTPRSSTRRRTQRHLVRLTGHEQARVRPYGKHLLIQMHRGDDVVDNRSAPDGARSQSIRCCVPQPHGALGTPAHQRRSQAGGRFRCDTARAVLDY